MSVSSQAAAGAAAKSLPALLHRSGPQILREWIAEQTAGRSTRDSSLLEEGELKEQCNEFIRLFADALQSGETGDVHGPAWEPVRTMLAELSRSRGLQGFTPSETATFVFSLKRVLFKHLQTVHGTDAQTLFDVLVITSLLLDKLGLFTTEIHQKTREEIILRQQEEMLELSTPVVKLWDGILALPMIGTLDSSRTQVVMQNLLEKIVESDAPIAILDITGVPTVDTVTAQHLLKTVAAARLMGADCIISGIRPQIAQTIVQLGVDLTGVTTKATLADAFSVALKRLGRSVDRPDKENDPGGERTKKGGRPSLGAR